MSFVDLSDFHPSPGSLGQLKDGDACVMKLLRRNVKDNGGALSLGIHHKRALQREMV